MNRNEKPIDPGETSWTEAVLPLVEEQLRVDKRKVVTGRVRVRTVTDTTEQLIRQELSGERVEVERVPLDRLIEPGAPLPQVRTEGNATIFPIVEEVLIVEKRLRLKEELRIVRYATKEVEETPIILHKQRVVVERLDSTGKLVTENTEQKT
jgi:stress response protein YsnF